MGKQLTGKPNIAVVTEPFNNLSPKGEAILRNYLELLAPIAAQIYVITGNFPDQGDRNVHIIRIKVPLAEKKGTFPLRIYRFLLIQLKISYHLLTISRNIYVVVFQFGTGPYLLPMLLTKLLRKRTVSLVLGRHSHFINVQYEIAKGLTSLIFKAIERIRFSLADQLGVLSKSCLNSLSLNKYEGKTAVTSAQYVNTDVYRINRPQGERSNLVGYIGGLALRKGVLNFARAIPLILRERDDVEFLIAGHGPLVGEIKSELNNSGLSTKVKLVEWIPEEKLPRQLNELKLFVLPSYEEGLPATLQQAMACGAIGLATPVGGIPDLIKDGETGFILPDNSPKTIAKNVIKALEHPKLGDISENAHQLIAQEYNYEALVRQCQNALDRLTKGGI